MPASKRTMSELYVKQTRQMTTAEKIIAALFGIGAIALVGWGLYTLHNNKTRRVGRTPGGKGGKKKAPVRVPDNGPSLPVEPPVEQPVEPPVTPPSQPTQPPVTLPIDDPVTLPVEPTLPIPEPVIGIPEPVIGIPGGPELPEETIRPLPFPDFPIINGNNNSNGLSTAGTTSNDSSKKDIEADRAKVSKASKGDCIRLRDTHLDPIGVGPFKSCYSIYDLFTVCVKDGPDAEQIKSIVSDSNEWKFHRGGFSIGPVFIKPQSSKFNGAKKDVATFYNDKYIVEYDPSDDTHSDFIVLDKFILTSNLIDLGEIIIFPNFDNMIKYQKLTESGCSDKPARKHRYRRNGRRRQRDREDELEDDLEEDLEDDIEDDIEDGISLSDLHRIESSNFSPSRPLLPA